MKSGQREKKPPGPRAGRLNDFTLQEISFYVNSDLGALAAHDSGGKNKLHFD